MVSVYRCCFVIALLLTTGFGAFAQMPADSFFYSPTFGGGLATINASGGNDTTNLNNAITNVAGLGGGTVSLSAGNYNLLDVQLMSNVHLRIDSGATISPFAFTGSGNRPPIFNAEGNTGLSNFSIEGTGGRFTVDFSGLAAGESGNSRAVQFQNASNFKLANMNVIDNFTKFSSLQFGVNSVNTTATKNGVANVSVIQSVIGVPHHGIIENASVTGAGYGYGLVQTQAGNNLLFRNLEATGGVALRLETGFSRLQFAEGEIFDAIKLDQIYARNISSINGQSAVQLSPHTLDQGTVDIDGVTAVSSEAGVIVSSGFINSGKEFELLTPGTFSSDSKIRNVDVTFGQNAQLHPSKRMRFLPGELRVARENGVGIDLTLSPDGESRLGPSVASVLQDLDNFAGRYEVDLDESTVTSRGFKIAEHHLNTNALIFDAFDDFELKEGETPGVGTLGTDVTFFVPSHLRQTPNRTLNAVSVPEPSAAICFGVVLGILFTRRRREDRSEIR